MKKYIFLSILVFLGTESFAQLKVLPSGRVGIGTNSPNRRLIVENGNIGVKKYGFELLLANNPDPQIGGSNNEIDFFYSDWNILKAKQYVKISDSTLKTNIVEFEYGLETILKLKTYSYNFKSDVGNDKAQLEYGFLSQEVKEVLPDVIFESRGNLLMDYDQRECLASTPMLVSIFVIPISTVKFVSIGCLIPKLSILIVFLL